MSMLNVIGLQMSNLTAYNEYITDVIIAVIVYLSAFALVIRMMFTKRRKPAVTSAPAEPPREDAPVPAAAETKEGGEQV